MFLNLFFLDRLFIGVVLKFLGIEIDLCGFEFFWIFGSWMFLNFSVHNNNVSGYLQ